MLDRLQSAPLRADLGEVRIGREIIVLGQTESTNDVVRQLGHAGEREGLVVMAEHQTAGRGQRGNKWTSTPHKAISFSVLLRPEIRLEDSGLLTQWAAETVASTIKNHCRIEASIKQPNDIYLKGRKVAGVLVEMVAQTGRPHLAVVGIGINVNQAPADFPAELRERAISIAMAAGSPQDRHQLTVKLLRNLDRTYPAVVTRK